MNKTALITGASRGIGKAIAIYFAKKGYNIIINSFSNYELLKAVKEEILSYGVDCKMYIGDMGYIDNCIEMFDLIKKENSHIDILVNNCGISHIGLLQDMTSNEWDNIIRTNLTSVFNCSKLAIPLMLQNKSGKIFNISSVWGVYGASCEVAYSATKGGINSFTKALAKELAPSNIQVNAIACGIINTDMNKFLDNDELNNIISEIPAGRLGTATEVARLIYDLSKSSNYLTGQIINIDGGWF